MVKKTDTDPFQKFHFTSEFRFVHSTHLFTRIDIRGNYMVGMWQCRRTHISDGITCEDRHLCKCGSTTHILII